MSEQGTKQRIVDILYGLDAAVTLPSWLEEGVQVRFDYGKGNPNNMLAHVRGIIDSDQVVYSVWSVRKQRYYYHIKDARFFAHEIERGVATYAGKDRGWMAKGYPCER